jgi:hypothetical protein
VEEEGMPVSKKPRSKTLVKTSPEAGAPAALPDRRAMESFLAAIAGHRGDDSTAKAQDVMYEAWERTTPRSRIALAHKALGISPLCADAYVLLAEEAGSIEEARDYYAKGVGGGVDARTGGLQAVCRPLLGFASQAEAKITCFSYIEGWYNPVRLHSGLGYRSPMTYEASMQTVKPRHSPQAYIPSTRAGQPQFRRSRPPQSLRDSNHR